RWHSHRQTSARLPGDGERNAGRRLAHARSVPLRREHAGERLLDANRENHGRPLSSRRLFLAAMKRRRTKRKVATRKNGARARAVVVREEKTINYRVAIPPAQRRLKFGDRWDYA